MDIYVYDQSFSVIGLIDTYDSLIWTDRLYSCGDFELSLGPTEEAFNMLQKNNYIWVNGELDENQNRRMMIIEGLEIETDPESGNKLIVTGRSLESLLDRRIIWAQTEIDDTFQNGISRLITENIITPISTTGSSYPARAMANFYFDSSSAPIVNALSLSAQYTGENLYEVLQELCEENKIGFKVVLDSNNQFRFSFLIGKDRSYTQTVNPCVVFSPTFENIINSRYKSDISKTKNVTLIGGEGEGNERIFSSYYRDTSSEPTGLNRKELFTDSSSISKKSYDTGRTTKNLTAAEYDKVLKESGREKLVDYLEVKEFESEIETNGQFKFNEDFFVGDYVQITNEYGIEGKALITESVLSHDSDGYKIYPAFVLVKTFEEEYVEIEYIETTGTQYIDTGLSCPNGFDFKARLTITALENTYALCGSHKNTSPYYRNFAGFFNGTGIPCIGINETTDKQATNVTLSVGTIYDMEWCNFYPTMFGKCDGVSITWNNTINDENARDSEPFYLFAMNRSGTPVYWCKWRLYSCSISPSTTLIARDFIPAKRLSDNKPGLYDKVTSKFYTNAGTGEFVIPT